MVNSNQIKRGLANFIDSEIMNKIPGGSIKRTLIGTMMGLYINNLEKTIKGMAANPFVSALGLQDESGNINIDVLAEELKKNMPQEGVKVDLDLLGFHFGDMVLRRGDIDTLRQRILTS